MSKCESGSGEPVSTTLSLSLLNWIEWAYIVYLSLFDMLVVVSRLLTLPTKCSTAGIEGKHFACMLCFKTNTSFHPYTTGPLNA